MSRAKWKNVAVMRQLKIVNQVFSKVWSRSKIIPGFLVNSTVLVYTGREFKKLYITRDKIGYKFGQFCFTRTLKKRVTNINKRQK
jgi:ribosomal protein S19